MIDKTFGKINSLFVLSFKNCDDNPAKNSFHKKYVSLVTNWHGLQSLIDNDALFDQPVKNKQEVYAKLVEMTRNNDSSTGKLLNYLYHQNYCKLIGIDLSRQETTYMPQHAILPKN